MKIRRQQRQPVSLDLTPLIDCVFQLLIFFMLSSSLLTPMIVLHLPEASVEDRGENTPIMVTVNREGVFYVNTTPIKREELGDRLRPLLAAAKRKAITFRGDEKISYELFVAAVDAARQAGAVQVDIAHDAK